MSKWTWQAFDDVLRIGMGTHFEDGMESDFSRAIIQFVETYEGEALAMINNSCRALHRTNEVMGEALRWIGRMEHEPTYALRLGMLCECLSSPSMLVRDGAGLGLSSLDDPRALPMLEQTIAAEQSPTLRRDLQQVADQLRETAAMHKDRRPDENNRNT